MTDVHPSPAARPFSPRAGLAVAALAALVLALPGCGGDGDDAGSGSESAPTVTPNADLDRTIASVHAALERQLGQAVPSLSVLIQTPTGAHFASAGSQPLTPDTRFRFASNTKNFTAAAVMKMHQDGWLRYSDRVTSTIPGSDQPYLPATAAWAVPYKERITIRQLLQHSAGVYDVGNDPLRKGEPTYEDQVLDADPGHTFTAEEMVSQAARLQLSYFEPGEGQHYSNTGYSMLSEVIARVYSQRSGRPRTYADYLRDHLVGPTAPVPLDVQFPDQGSDQALPGPRACGRILLPGQALDLCEANVSAKVAEGNGIGTMRQLAHWVRTLHYGRNVLTPATVALMHGDRATDKPDYALGTFEVPNLGFGHNGATLGNLSLMVHDPATQVSVVVYLPLWDLTDEEASFRKTFNALECTGWRAREALGFAGRPAGAECAPE